MLRSLPKFARRDPIDFYTLAKKSLFKPDTLSHLQTDGSFRCSDRISRTAGLLRHDGDTYKSIKTYFDHRDSYDSEWNSVLDGIRMAKGHDAGAIKVENDNLGVINSLIYKKRPTREFALHCYFSILKEAKNMEWLDIRWIPRRMNKADRLFHL